MTAVVLAPLVLAAAVLAWVAAHNRRLLAAGVPGEATVLSLTDTGVVVGGRPVLRLALRVEVDGVDPYDTEASTGVPTAALPLLRPGARVAVRVDATSPTTLAVDLSRLSVTPAAALAA